MRLMADRLTFDWKLNEAMISCKYTRHPVKQLT